MTQTCAYCERPSGWLCDHVVIHNRAGGKNQTCDRPLCNVHRHCQVSGIACTRGRRSGGCQIFSIDYCPDHAPTPKET